MGSSVIFDCGKLLKKLHSLQEMSWGFEIKRNLEKLNCSLSSIEAVLLDAKEKQRTNPQIQDWLKETGLVFNDLEDLFQEFSTETLKRQVMTKNKKANKKVHIFFSSSTNQVKFRLKMGPKVKLVLGRLQAIALGRDRFNLIERREEMPGNGMMMRTKRRDETHSFTQVIVGREKNKHCIIQHLFESDDLETISIIGISGVGKTTLAELVFNAEEVEEHFDLRIWVYVSDVFDVRVICEKIILYATSMNCEGLPMDRVKDRLQNLIGGRKHLLVLDDVWNEDPTKWTELKELLICCAKGSKILVTARAHFVAKAMNSIRIHLLKGLTPEESWMLFEHFAFRGKGFPESSTIHRIVNDVLKRCVGIPLIIKMVGCMLGLKGTTEKDWLAFERNDLQWMEQYRDSELVPPLKLCYDSLSPPLKRCFGYCVGLPEEHKIYKTTLIRLWMAQGFLEMQDETSNMRGIESLEDVGEQYFMDLLMMSFFQGSETDETGDICCFKIHDSIRYLGQEVEGRTGSYVSDVGETTRHAWVTGDLLTRLYGATKLRTLVVTTPVDAQELAYNKVLSKSKHMRVLGLAESKITSVPYFVGGLICLNYLDLSGNTFNLLPESISSLYNLQTLILTSCKNLTELPKGTRNLVSLRHLDITGCDNLSRMPRGLGELTCLRTLSDFVLGAEGKKCAQLVELKSLVNLRGTVTLRNLSANRAGKREKDERYYPDLLTQHKFIDYLWLEWSLEDEVEAEEELLLLESLQPHRNVKKLYLKDYGGVRFPSWMDTVDVGISFPNIVYIGITNCRSCENLPPFGLLPSLEHLFLWDMPRLRYIYDGKDRWNSSTSTSSLPGSSSGRLLFPSLKKLDLFKMPKLIGLGNRRSTVEGVVLAETSRHFPVLEELYICGCPSFIPPSSEEDEQLQLPTSLRSLYIYNSVHRGLLLPGLQYLPNLQSLTLDHCENMETLPHWIGNLPSIREIHLKYCRSLDSIPNYFRGLIRLKRLLVRGCPEIRKRCEKEDGVDFPKIAHIQYVSLR